MISPWRRLALVVLFFGYGMSMGAVSVTSSIVIAAASFVGMLVAWILMYLVARNQYDDVDEPHDTANLMLHVAVVLVGAAAGVALADPGRRILFAILMAVAWVLWFIAQVYRCVYRSS